MSDNQDSRKQRHGRTGKDVVMPTPPPSGSMPDGYGLFLENLKARIKQERLKAVFSANAAMVLMYWDIGTLILGKQQEQGWGAKIIDRLSHDLKKAFPQISGFSPRNLKYMRKFAQSWPDKQIVQEVLAQITWYHNLALLEKLKTPEDRIWYAQKTVENGWSRNILVSQIQNRLQERIGRTTSNFETALLPADSDMADQIFKDPYVFDFLGTDELRRESELEQRLMDHLEKFLLELGQGFAFVGRQVHMEVGDDDCYIDLLFYHLKLRRYVVVELKAGKFQAGFISQLSTYMNIVDDLLRHPDDKKTIGLLLVKERNQTLAKYDLQGYTNPIGVANWEKQITESLPDEFKSSLPTIEEIEQEMNLQAGTLDKSQ